MLPGLVVRLLNHSLNNGAFFHQVGIVRRTVDVFGGEVHMETGDIIVVDQEECEPVLPAVGQCGICVRGKWANEGRVRVVAMGLERSAEQYEKRTDPRGRNYFWALSSPTAGPAGQETDVAALQQGSITLTPLDFDLTKRSLLTEMEPWKFDLPQED